MNAKLLSMTFILVSALLFVPLTHAEEPKDDPPVIVLGGGGVPMLNEKVDRNFNAILDVPGVVIDSLIDILPPPPPAPRPNLLYTVWVGVRVHSRAYQADTLSILQYEGTYISFLNPGSNTAEVSCTFFNNNGNLLFGQGGTQILGRGAKGFCGLNSGINESLYGWVLITSDQPIFPEGYDVTKINYDRESAIKFYPIDCADPTGVEFVCQFVNN